MNKKILIGGLVVIAVIAGIILTNDKPQASEIKIGALYALSGPAAKFGEISVHGVRDAVKYFEEKTGTKVSLTIEDTANDPKVGVSAATKMFELDKVKFAVVGTSGITNAVAPIAEKAGVIMITDAAGYGLTKDKKYLHQNLLPSLDDVSKQINSNSSWKNVALVLINDEFGNIWGNKWTKDIDRGQNVKTFSFEKSATDFKTEAAKIKSFGPDVIAVIGYGPALNQVFADMSTQGIDAPKITYLACTFPGVIGDKRYDLNGDFSYEYPEYQAGEIKDWVKNNGGVDSTFYGLAFENTLALLNAANNTDSDTEKALEFLKTNETVGVYGDIIFDQNNVVERGLVQTKIVGGVCER